MPSKSKIVIDAGYLFCSSQPPPGHIHSYRTNGIWSRKKERVSNTWTPSLNPIQCIPHFLGNWSLPTPVNFVTIRAPLNAAATPLGRKPVAIPKIENRTDSSASVPGQDNQVWKMATYARTLNPHSHLLRSREKSLIHVVIAAGAARVRFSWKSKSSSWIKVKKERPISTPVPRGETAHQPQYLQALLDCTISNLPSLAMI